jgi:hypothetical protein
MQRNRRRRRTEAYRLYRLVQAFVLFGILGGCSSTRSGAGVKDQAITPGDGYKVTDKDKLLVIEKGDQRAYDHLRYAYLHDPIHDEFLYYAMVMANKYGDAQGCYDTFSILLTMRKKIEAIDSDTANVAMMYLLMAYRKRHHQAVDAVEEHSVVYDEATNREQLIRIYGCRGPNCRNPDHPPGKTRRYRRPDARFEARSQ